MMCGERRSHFAVLQQAGPPRELSAQVFVDSGEAACAHVLPLRIHLRLILPNNRAAPPLADLEFDPCFLRAA